MHLTLLIVAAMCAGVARAKELPADTNKMIDLMPEQAALLMERHQGGRLSLDGLSALSPETANSLAAFKGTTISLRGLTELSAESAKAIADFRGSLWLDGLTSLDADTAKALGQSRGDDLSLDGLTELSASAAHGLAQYKGNLSLNGVSTLSDDAALALAEHESAGVALGGLKHLSIRAAKSLLKHGNLVNTPLFRKLSGEVISLEEIEAHQKKCVQVNREFLPKYLDKHPGLKKPYPKAVGYNIRVPFGDFRLSPVRYSATIEFYLAVYERGMNNVLIPSVQPSPRTGQPDLSAIVRAIDTLMDPENFFLEAKNAVWMATPSKDVYVIIGKQVLTHEELWQMVLPLWQQADQKRQKEDEVPRVR